MESDYSSHPPPSLLEYTAPVLEKSADTSTEFKIKGDANLDSIKKSSVKLRKILSSMLPPRAWNDSTGTWRQRVSEIPPSRAAVLKVQEDFEKQLVNKEARETPVCPVREELVSQLFDELIRQETLSSSEVGLMLLRMRDESRMTIKVYETLYSSSLNFGIQKTVEAEEAVKSISATVSELEAKKAKLKLQYLSKKQLVTKLEEKCKAECQKRKDRHRYVVEFLKKETQSLKEFADATEREQ